MTIADEEYPWERITWPDRCLTYARSNWPVWHYDGRWRCSRIKGHDGQHLAFENHVLTGKLAWLGGWVDDEDDSITYLQTEYVLELARSIGLADDRQLKGQA